MKYALRAATFALSFAALPAMADDFTSGSTLHRASGPNCAAIEVRVDSSPLDQLVNQTVWFELMGNTTGLSGPQESLNKNEVLEDFIASVPGTAVSFVVVMASGRCSPHGAAAMYGAAAMMQ